MRIIFISTLLLSCLSCVAVGTRVGEEQLMQLERGKTSYFDVISQLGKPNQSIFRDDGTRQISYSYTQSQMKAQNFIPIVAAFAQGATSETSVVTLDFDARQILVSFSATTGQTAVGTGLMSGGKQ